MECVLRYRHLLHAVDVLHVDQGCKNRFGVLVVCVCAGLLLHGEWMEGRITGLTERADRVFFVCRFPPGEAMCS